MNLAPIQILFAQGIELSHSASNPVAQSTWTVLSDLMLIVGAGLGIAALLIVWVLYARKRRLSNHHHQHRQYHQHHQHGHQERSSAPARPPEPVREEESDDSDQRQHHHHRRRRVRRRDHRPRNPTLAETGGLPPVRPGDASPPPAL